MRNKKTFIGVALVIAVLLIGIGYAAISNVTLKISGSATASPSDANFVVKFTGTPTTGGAGKTTATIDTENDETGKTATIEVTGLTAKGQTATATYTILNESPDLSASLAAEVTKNTNTEYFKVTPTFEATTITAEDGKDSTEVTVTVELIKTPVTGDVSSEIEVTLTASPVQPTTGETTGE